MKRALTVLLVAAAVVGLAYLAFGRFLPAEHDARCRLALQTPPDRVWERISDVAHWGDWLPESRITLDAGGDRWIVTGPGGDSRLAVVTTEPGRQLVARVLSAPGGFTGTWTYVVDPDDRYGTVVTVSEHGVVENPFQRAVAALTSDPADRISAFLLALARSFGDAAKPVELP